MLLAVLYDEHQFLAPGAKAPNHLRLSITGLKAGAPTKPE
jgi:hypothetical protein